MKYILIILLNSVILNQAFPQSHNKELVDHIYKSLNNCNYYEVTEEMFNLISEDERYQNEAEIEYLKKIKYLIYVECSTATTSFYDSFMPYNLAGFKMLMKSKTQNDRYSFYRKKNGELYEYLLVHNSGMSYIITSLNISTLNELSGIMNMVGEMGMG